METLGQRFGTPGGYYLTGDEDDRGTPRGKQSGAGKTQERWKTGAKKALLQWCQNQVRNVYHSETTLNYKKIILGLL